MAFLDYQGGHHLAEGLRRDFRHPEGEVSHRVQFLHQPQLRTTLLQLIESFYLMDLQDDNGIQGGGRLSSGMVSLSSQSCCHLTCLRWETQTILPGFSTLWAQVPPPMECLRTPLWSHHRG